MGPTDEDFLVHTTDSSCTNDTRALSLHARHSYRLPQSRVPWGAPQQRAQRRAGRALYPKVASFDLTLLHILDLVEKVYL